MSEWADEFRQLSPESAAEPGNWHTDRNEPMRAVMDIIGDREVETVVLMTSAQVGKSETILNILGYHIDQDPAPILMVLPTLDVAGGFSTDRVAPMLRDTKQLHGKVKDARSRDSGNKILYKSFPGGYVVFAGANSPASLSSRPIRIVLCDEVDKYPASAGAEGDPVSLARKRTKTFWNRKIVMASTPSVKDLSRIEAEWKESDQRRFHVPCPFCGHKQILRWRGVVWPQGKPDAAKYKCESCSKLWDDHSRIEAIKDGEWIAEAEFNGTVGFHLNEIYSPWVRLGEMAKDFLVAKRSPDTLKTFVNASLGESFEIDTEKVDAHVLEARVEEWGKHAPEEVLVVTCGVDTQDNRLEVERVGWGVDEESWSLDHKIIYGDPAGKEVWKELDEYLLEETVRADGLLLPVSATAIDSAGHHSMDVYKFCKDRLRRRVFAIIGRSGPGKLVWPKRATKTNKAAVLLFTVGIDPAKDAIFARLRLNDPGPGYCHFPKGRDHIYFDQLTSEQVMTKMVQGYPHRVYFLPSGRRNEALDLRVYAYAALQSLNVRWGHVLAKQQTAQRIVVPPHLTEVPEPDDVRSRALPGFRFPEQTVAPSQAQGRRPVRRSQWMDR